MGKLWDEFKKNMTYEEPQVRSGYREKSVKELYDEVENLTNKINPLLSKRRNLLEEGGVKLNKQGNVALFDDAKSELKIGEKYKKSDFNALENTKKAGEVKKTQEYKDVNKEIVKLHNERAYKRQEANEKYAEQEAKELNTAEKIAKGFALGWWNKQIWNKSNEDMLMDENGNIGWTITGDRVDTAGESLAKKQAENETGLGKIAFDASIGAGELGSIFTDPTTYITGAILPGGGISLNYYADIFSDTYREDVKNGVSEDKALQHALGISMVDAIKSKFIGSIAGNAIGISEKSLEGGISKMLEGKISNKVLNDVISRTSGGFIDEFTDGLVEKMWENYTLKGAEHTFDDVFSKENLTNSLYEGALGAILEGNVQLFTSSVTPKSQKSYEQAVYDYERKTGNQLSENNKNALAEISQTYKEVYGVKPTSEKVLEDFARIKEKQIKDYQDNAFETVKGLDEVHQKEYNEQVNDVSQVIYDTGINVRYDLNQNKKVDWDNGTLVLNPTQTAEPLKNIVLHEISKQTVDSDTQNYIINKLKKDGVYETYKEELLATGEYDDFNVDQEIVAQELDAILQNDNEIKELSQKDKGLFNNIKNAFNTLTGKLTNNRNTRDALYFREVNDRINNLYGEGDLNDLNKISDNLINNTNEEETTLKTNKKGATADNKQQQLDIINKSNPAPNETNTWIRNKEDIKTFKEAYDTAKEESEDGGWKNYASYPDITNEMVDKALETGKITVYSSYPIENGVFVTPSYQQALDYAGNDESNVNSKEVNLDDVAWVNLDEGQYAKVENKEEVKKEYKSNEKLPETTKTGTYIEPTTPIDLNSKKGKKYLQQISGDSKYSSLIRAKSKNYTAFVDKLNPIQEIADASGNNQLYPKFNNRGMSNGMGQYQLGTAQTDINGVEIGKSLNDIWLPVENAKLVDEFNDYLAHRLNEERYDKVPVWDESVTPEISREKINEYETKYPQFKKWNKYVYKYNDNLLQKMIDAGLSKENARDWLYKNYVTIARDLGNGTSPLLTNAKGVKVNSPIRKAKGGNYDMRPMKESMARQTLLTERAIADNIAGQELLNVLGGKVGDSKTYLGEDLEGNNNALMKNQDGTYNYTVYKNGIPVTMQITKEVADAIRPTQRGEWENLFIPKVAQTVSKWQRTLLTDKNPLFIFTNFFKDFGDALLNSKYTAGEYFTMYPQAIAKMASNSPEWKQYVAKGGKSNTYFDVKEGEVKLSKNTIKRGGQKFLQAVENANQFIEQAPRFTEYLNSLAHGESQDVALYNSAEITTNFARGGEITKALNRNGFNFLNASVQGFDKQIRNFKNQPGAKGYVQLLAKVIALGVAPAMLNHILLEDDDDYEELPDYIKDNYYLFKTGDNKFIRIPKGRALSVFGTSAMHTYNVAKGKEELGSALKDTTETLLNNVAPNNPLENNVASPLISYKTNIAWNGSPIVPKRLQSLPESEQYDEKTSSIAKWLGQTLESSPLGKSFDFSPKKIDYLLDQYTGAIGDFVLPMTTPSAENDIDSPVGKLVIAPFKSKFTSDSTISSKYVSDFYDTKDQLDKEMKFVSDIEESEETFRKSLQAKYLASVNQEMSELYAQKRTIENSDLSDSDKYNQARAIQRKIDDIAKFALQDYQTGYYTDDYAVVGDKEYYISWNNTTKKFTWTAVSEKTKKKQEEYAQKYDMSPEEYYSMDLLTKSKIAGISGGMYKDYVKLNDELTKITDNTHDDKNATFEFVNNLDIPMIQKAMFIKMHYPSYRDYDQEIFNWVDANTYNEYEAKAMLIKLGFYYDKKTNTYYAKEPKKSSK